MPGWIASAHSSVLSFSNRLEDHRDRAGLRFVVRSVYGDNGDRVDAEVALNSCSGLADHDSAQDGVDVNVITDERLWAKSSVEGAHLTMRWPPSFSAVTFAGFVGGV